MQLMHLVDAGDETLSVELQLLVELIQYVHQWVAERRKAFRHEPLRLAASELVHRNVTTPHLLHGGPKSPVNFSTIYS